mmetsp:Transcript_18922/g.39385  ORF Transcript_18922/g.39385 Transcript_18922/m.39385 type:complete len:563 (+) Transcript_18922:164-1852(+)
MNSHLTWFLVLLTASSTLFANAQPQKSRPSSPPSDDLSTLLESTDPGTLRRHASLALTERLYDKSLALYTAAINLEPENGANYVKRYKVYKRVQSMVESMAGNAQKLKLSASLSSLSPADFASRMIRDLDSAIEISGWGDVKKYTGDGKKDKQAIEAIESRANLLASQANCTFAEKDYNLLISLPSTIMKEEKKQGYRDKLPAMRQCRDIMNVIKALTAAPNPSTQNNMQIVSHITNLLSIISASPPYLLKLRALASINLSGSDNMYSAITDLGTLIKFSPNDVSLYEMRGGAYFNIGELDVALTHYKSGLKQDPEHKGCKKEHKTAKAVKKKLDRAKEAEEQKDWEKALGYYREVRTLLEDRGDRLSKDVLVNMCLTKLVNALTKTNTHDEAVKLAETVVQLHKSPESYICLGEAMTGAERFEDAVRFLKDGVNQFPESNPLKEAVQKAEVALKQSKTKDYYKILGVSRNADKSEIKKGYKKMAMQWHPDKNKGNEEEAEKKFTDVAEAYEVLSDDELRARYDRGEDVMDKSGGGGGRHGPNMHHFRHGNPGQHFNFHFNM